MKTLQKDSNCLSGKLVVEENKFQDLSLIRDELVVRIDPVDLCNYFDVQSVRSFGKEIRCCCPIHNGDGPQNFRIKTIDSFGNPMFSWQCFSNKCQDDFYGDIFGFVRGITGCGLKEAIAFLMEFAGMSANELPEKISLAELETRKEMSRFCAELSRITEVPSGPREERHPFLNEDFVARSLERRNNYFINRGINENVLNIFEVGHCSSPDTPWVYSPHKNRAVIPIRDENLKLCGVAGRAETDEIESGDAKYRFLPGSDRENVLYGYCFARPYIEEKGSVVLVEGFADLWKCWMSGIKNTVAIMGKDITDGQMIRILKSCYRILIVFDFDGGKNLKNVEKAKDRLCPFLTVKYDFIHKDKDLGSSSVEEIRSFFEKYRYFI